MPELRRGLSHRMSRQIKHQQKTSRSLGASSITVLPGDDIQKAIDKLNAEGGGLVQLVAGTYKPITDINLKSNVSLVGVGIDITIIDFVDGAFALQGVGTASVILNNILVSNLTTQNSAAAAGVTMQFADFWRFEEVRVHSCNTSGFRVFDCRYWVLDQCRSSSNGASGFFITSSDSRTNIRFRIVSCNADSNGTNGFRITTSSNDLFWANLIGCIASSNTTNGFNFEGVSVSVVESSAVGCIASGNGGKGFASDSTIQRMRFVNCVADTNTGDGFEVVGAGCSVIGCISGDGFDFQAAGNFIGNDNTFPTSDPKLQYIVATDVQIQSHMNLNENTRTIRKTMLMKNTSGGALARGDVVILKAVASGDEVTTTTTTGDTKVFGMVQDASIADNAWGMILVEGYTVSLKVDGTTDIAIGDYLSTFTTAKIAKKASAGEIAFAIALEAYATNDSLGVIDALLVKVRQI